MKARECAKAHSPVYSVGAALSVVKSRDSRKTLKFRQFEPTELAFPSKNLYFSTIILQESV